MEQYVSRVFWGNNETMNETRLDNTLLGSRGVSHTNSIGPHTSRYTPCPELVDVVGLLRHTGRLKNHLSFSSTPETLPAVYLDPQLLHCVHRNAVSNACKYGQANGEIITRVSLTLRREPIATQDDACRETGRAVDGARSAAKREPQPVQLVPSTKDSAQPAPQTRTFAEYELTLEVVNAPGPALARRLFSAYI